MKNLKTAQLSFFVLWVFLLSVCSTPPKNPGEISDLRRRAESQLELANKQADRDSFEEALAMVDEAKRLGIAADDPDLRTRAGLLRGNVLFSLGREDEAAAEWNEALSEAERTGNAELAAVSRIHIARGKLRSPGGKAGAQSVLDETNRNLAQIKSSRHYIAFAWTLVGLAEKELGRYDRAEAALNNSLKIHEKDRYFELAAYDWYLTASFRSLSRDYNGARQALEKAIAFDRRIENSWGLASDWRALGDVEKKAGNAEAARAAYIRASEIFRSIESPAAAEEALSRIER